jgi:hypothetical protein
VIEVAAARRSAIQSDLAEKDCHPSSPSPLASPALVVGRVGFFGKAVESISAAMPRSVCAYAVEGNSYRGRRMNVQNKRNFDCRRK